MKKKFRKANGDGRDDLNVGAIIPTKVAEAYINSLNKNLQKGDKALLDKPTKHRMDDMWG